MMGLKKMHHQLLSYAQRLSQQYINWRIVWDEDDQCIALVAVAELDDQEAPHVIYAKLLIQIDDHNDDELYCFRAAVFFVDAGNDFDSSQEQIEFCPDEVLDSSGDEITCNVRDLDSVIAALAKTWPDMYARYLESEREDC
jgi:hypothetical protein